MNAPSSILAGLHGEPGHEVRLPTQRMLIGGAWEEAEDGRIIEVEDPATGKVFASVPAGTAADVDRAVTKARAAFEAASWARMRPLDRGKIIEAIARKIEDHAQELALLESYDNGKAVHHALAVDVPAAVDIFRYMAGWASKIYGQVNPISGDGRQYHSYSVREPIGVVGQIVPWNYPLAMAAWKIASALAAGCTIVLKPSEVTPLTALRLAELALEAGLPEGVLNIVTGYGHEAGQALVEHPGIDKIAFTGSVPTGRKIMQAAAAEIKNMSLELGGKSPFVIFADSDLDAAVEWILFGIFWNQGQACSATSRVLVERALYPALLERLIAATEQIQIGQGFTDGVKLGPLVSQGQRDKVLEAIAAGQQEGARLVLGGTRPAHLQKGYYMTPAIFADVPEQSSVWREEIFGPVVCLRAFDTEAEAIRLANDSPFGLAAAVMSRDIPRCERVARRFRAGIVWVNCSQPTFVEAPWGGYKQSGIGRELGEWGYNNYLETKQITQYNGGAWGWYLS